jgi:hypothetical protein
MTKRRATVYFVCASVRVQGQEMTVVRNSMASELMFFRLSAFPDFVGQRFHAERASRGRV